MQCYWLEGGYRGAVEGGAGWKQGLELGVTGIYRPAVESAVCWEGGPGGQLWLWQI